MDANLRVLTRKDLISHVESQMSAPIRLRAGGGESHPESFVLKTYLVEATIPEDAPAEQASGLAKNLLNEAKLPQTGTKIFESDEQDLLTLQARSKSRDITAYLDLSNPRFWLVHSFAPSLTLDPYMRRLFAAGPELDRAWIPWQLLDRVSEMGALRGLGLAYDRRVLEGVDTEPSGAPIEFLKMQLWGSHARTILNTLREQQTLPNATTLSKVRISHNLSGDIGPGTLEEVKYDGKITGRGPSFQSHIALVSHVTRLYTHRIRAIESAYGIRAIEEVNRTRIIGEPICFGFTRPIEQLGAFCKALFSAREPFRLWGVPIEVAPSVFRVRAVDLHVGSQLHFEITPEYMRVYLPDDACGNTIMRLFTNLQHHYDALITATNSTGMNVFEF